MKIVSCFLTLSIMISLVSAQYDDDFWEGLDEEELPYEHPWADIPDLVNKTEIQWYFNMTHHFLTGIERGMYMNDSIVLHEHCFGPKYVDKINWMAAMIQADILEHWIQELAIIYQLYYMWSDKCKIDQTFNDFYVFCWNHGCMGE